MPSKCVGLQWIHAVKLDEPDFGLEARVEGPNYVASNLRKGGAAWRAGLRDGALLISYHLEPLLDPKERTRTKKEWSADTIDLVNALPSRVVVAIWVKQDEDPSDPRLKQRRLAVRRQLTAFRHNRRSNSGQTFDEVVAAWDAKHYPQDASSSDAEQEASSPNAAHEATQVAQEAAQAVSSPDAPHEVTQATHEAAQDVSSPDAAHEATHEAAQDVSSPDAAHEATQAAHEATQAAHEATQDVSSPDAAHEAAQDVSSPDAAHEAAQDVSSPDTVYEASPDAAYEASPDISSEDEQEAFPDTAYEASPDAIPDAEHEAADSEIQDESITTPTARMAANAPLSPLRKRPPPIKTDRPSKKYQAADQVVDQEIDQEINQVANLSIPVQQTGGPLKYIEKLETRKCWEPMRKLTTSEIDLCCSRFAQTVSYARFSVVMEIPEHKDDFGIVTCILGSVDNEWWLIIVTDQSIIVDNEPLATSAIEAMDEMCNQVKHVLDVEDITAVISRPTSCPGEYSMIRVLDRVRTLAKLARTAVSPDSLIYGIMALIQDPLAGDLDQDYLAAHKQIEKDLVDAIRLATYQEPCWALTQDENGRKIWWPARPITTRLAKQVFSVAGRGQPVVWFVSGSTDSPWVKPEHIRPFNDPDIIDEVEKAASILSEIEVTRLQIAFNQARIFFNRNGKEILNI